jgi:tellurite resistance protein TerC
MLDLPSYVWIATIGGFVLLLVLDQVVSSRQGEHEPTTREATGWVLFYVLLAGLFGVGLTLLAGGKSGGEFFAGYLTEYSLSVDNLFVFVVLLARFDVPRVLHHKVLLVGIGLALVLRGAFIAAGAAAINEFVWIFFVFGAFLVYTAYGLAKADEEDHEPGEDSRLMLLVRRVLPTSEEFDGASLTTRVDGRKLFTPLLLVMIAIGTTDLLFALDSIPAIFGLTQEPYIVFTANAFALMGLRQLYFLLDGLLDRLVYLNKGLAVVLGFIGVKLVFHALHEYGVDWAPDIGIVASLAVIVGALAVTTIVSLRATVSRAG